MKRVTYAVSLKVRGPVLTKSSSIGELGIDAVMARSRFNHPQTGVSAERFYLPGSLLKGLLREAWQELACFDSRYDQLLDEWLGQPSPIDSDDRPERGRLHFTDFADWSTETDEDHGKRYRIQIDDVTGAATGQMLQVIESPYAPGKPILFQGKIRLLLSDKESSLASTLTGDIERGFHWLRAAGGNRTVGFGQIEDATVAIEDTESLPTNPQIQQTNRWRLVLTFTEPLALAKRRIAENLFESADTIAGGTLKGAIANMIAVEAGAFKELSNELAQVGFTHAFPSQNEQRPRAVPLSLISQGDGNTRGNLRDVIYRSDQAAGSFDIDWKRELTEDAKHAFGWPRTEWQLRVRTAIESEHRAAKDTALFGWQMILPDGLQWIAEADVSRLSTEAREQLATLLEFGIEPIGKTKALSKTQVSTATGTGVTPAVQYVITLQTSALLIDPERHPAPGGALGTSKQSALWDEYSEAWAELSAGSLRLVRYFHRCTLAGSGYFQARFGERDKPYKPYLLTDAGSTFLLAPTAGQEIQAAAVLNTWHREGLPLREGVRRFYGLPDDRWAQWSRCPYVPENGYGEILVNERHGEIREA